MHRYPRAASLVVLALAATSPGFAGESSETKAAADALFKAGKKAMDSGKLDEACPKLAESYRLSERLGTLLNLATCHEKQGKTASAWAEFNEARAMAHKAQSKERETYAEKHADELEQKLARVRFVAPPSSAGATLSLDGKELGSGMWGTPLPVDPGSHEVVVTAPGKQPWRQSFEVAASAETKDVGPPVLEAEKSASAESDHEARAKEPAPEPARDEPRPQSSSGSRTLGWVALGVGVVGVGVGSVFGLRTFSKKNDAKAHCGSNIGQSDDALCDATGVDLRSQAKSSATLSTVAFAVGAVGLGTGVVLLLTSGSKKEKSARGLWVAPALGPRAGGISVGASL